MTLPVAPTWYSTHQIDARTWCLGEPHVHPVFSANIFLVLGRDRDLVIDSGMGIAPLRPALDALRPDPGKPLSLLTTHAHVDHVGAAHECDTHLAHALEAPDLAAPPPASLHAADWPDGLKAAFTDAGYPPFWPLLIDALPHPDYDPAAYALTPAPVTQTVGEGDTVDLGDWQAEVLHLPGHAAGQIGLWHAGTGTLFAADALYDGPLICIEGVPGMDRAAYVDTLARIEALPLQRVLGGHDPAMDAYAARRVAAHYRALWS